VQTLAGIHPVLEALKSGQPVDRVHIAKGAGGQRLQEIVDLCRARKLPIRFEERAAPVTEVAAKAAAGALAHLPVIKVGNLNQALEKLKKQGYWIYGLDERGTEPYDTVSYTEPAVLVVGAEGHGLHHLTAKHCDVLVRIPMAGKIASLNVSVATGIALFDWRRRRDAD
jgi:tRNA G18 (ribose-2'-O)-methylase SpoU